MRRKCFLLVIIILCTPKTYGQLMINRFFLCWGLWWYTRKNRRRDEKFGVSTSSHGLENLTDNERKDFRYVV
jgi:hypothetical protein